MAHTIDSGKCATAVCGACKSACPVDAIKGHGVYNVDYYVIDAGLCTDCGACVDSSPVDAISAP